MLLYSLYISSNSFGMMTSRISTGSSRTSQPKAVMKLNLSSFVLPEALLALVGFAAAESAGTDAGHMEPIPLIPSTSAKANITPAANKPLRLIRNDIMNIALTSLPKLWTKLFIIRIFPSGEI